MLLSPRVIACIARSAAPLFAVAPAIAESDPARAASSIVDTPLASLVLEPDLDWLAQSEALEQQGHAPEDIYEALLSRFCFAQDEDNLVATYVEIEKRSLTLPVGDSRLFASEEERDGFLAALAALQASRWKDVSELRRHARQAFQQNPGVFAIFKIEKKLQEAWDRVDDPNSRVELDLAVALEDTQGKPVELGELLEGKKGLYLDFWASWCGPCLRAMPELKRRSERYADQGLVLAGVNTDHEVPRQKAIATRDRFGFRIPWLVEPPSEPISNALDITSIPRIVLINPQGKVLFNGHPEDVELKLKLLELGIAP